MKILFSECDIEYIDPTSYQPPEDSSDTVKIKNGLNEDDPYEKIIKGNLQLIEKQKVSVFEILRTLGLVGSG